MIGHAHLFLTLVACSNVHRFAAADVHTPIEDVKQFQSCEPERWDEEQPSAEVVEIYYRLSRRGLCNEDPVVASQAVRFTTNCYEHFRKEQTAELDNLLWQLTSREPVKLIALHCLACTKRSSEKDQQLETRFLNGTEGEREMILEGASHRRAEWEGLSAVTVKMFAELSAPVRATGIKYLANHPATARTVALAGLQSTNADVRCDAIVLITSTLNGKQPPDGLTDVVAVVAEHRNSSFQRERLTAIECLGTANSQGQFDQLLYNVARSCDEVIEIKRQATMGLSRSENAKRKLLELLETEIDLRYTSLLKLAQFESDAVVGMSFVHQLSARDHIVRVSATNHLLRFLRDTPESVTHQLRKLAELAGKESELEAIEKQIERRVQREPNVESGYRSGGYGR
jgi:hypothetical protein